MKKEYKKFIVPSILLLIFILIMVLVLLGYTTSIDSYVYNLVTSNMTDGKNNFFKFITLLGSTKYMICMCIVFLIIAVLTNKKRLTTNVILGLITSTIVNNVIKIIVCRERPDVLKLVEETTYSFPSGHTMAATMLYGILIYYVYNSKLNKYIKILLITLLSLLIILIMISRIYLGAHYATDVVAGLFLSAFLVIIMVNICKKITE